MYNNDIKHYKHPDGEIITGETFLYSVPITDSNMSFVTPVVKSTIGKTGSFEFSIYPNHDYYDSWLQMVTIMRVVFDGETIFRGRVLTIDCDKITGVKRIHCEGDMAFLIDSQYPGEKEEKRNKITCLAYMTALINNHNSQVESDKRIQLGEVPGNYSNAIPDKQRVKPDNNYRYGSDSWSSTMKCFEQLTTDFGGFLRTRYVDDVCYLDWLNDYFREPQNPQPIEIGENVISMQDTAEVENIFTAVIPIGKSKSNDIYIEGYRTDIHGANNKRILVPQILDVFSDAELNSGYHSKEEYAEAINKFGYIYKPVKFENADTQEKLWNYAVDWIKDNYNGGLNSFSVTALDMHHFNPSTQKYLTGDVVPIVYPYKVDRYTKIAEYTSKNLTITEIQYNLHNPENNTYSIGIPNSLLKKTYGEAVKSSGGGGGSKLSEKNDNDTELWLLDRMATQDSAIWAMVWNDYYNSDFLQSLAPQGAKLAMMADFLIIKSTEKISETQEALRSFWEIGNGGYFIGRTTTNAIVTLLDTVRQRFIIQKDDNSGSGKLSFLVDGLNGALKMFNPNALTLSENRPNILIDGVNEALNMYQTDVLDDIPEISMLAGSNIGEGILEIGKKFIGGDADWKVKLNDYVTYEDSSGNTHTANGFVSAEDFSIPTIDSFKTKMAYIDNLFARTITTETLSAQLADLSTVILNTLYVNVYVTTPELYVSRSIHYRNRTCQWVEVPNIGYVMVGT